MDGLEPALREWLSGQGVEAQSIECPKARVIKAGSVFDCAVTAADGTSLTIEVTQDDDQGNVSWVIK